MIEALVTAGGKGTRMKDVQGEKPLLPVLGRPMVDRVVDALRSSGRFDRVCVSVSDNAPRTREHLLARGVEVLETSGDGYVEDLNRAMSVLRASEVLVCPADMPLLTGKGVDRVIDHYRSAGVASLSVAVPMDLARSMGVTPSFTLDVDGRVVVLCGVSVVDREQILTGNMLSQGYMVTEDERFALNVNTREELNIAEHWLSHHDEK